MDFPGNLMVVSHDRYFDKIVDSLFVFNGNGVLTFSNYTDYRVYESSQVKEAKTIIQNLCKKEHTTQGLSYKEKQEFNSLESEIEALETKRKNMKRPFFMELFPENKLMSFYCLKK